MSLNDISGVVTSPEEQQDPEGFLSRVMGSAQEIGSGVIGSAQGIGAGVIGSAQGIGRLLSPVSPGAESSNEAIREKLKLAEDRIEELHAALAKADEEREAEVNAVRKNCETKLEVVEREFKALSMAVIEREEKSNRTEKVLINALEVRFFISGNTGASVCEDLCKCA